MNASEFNSLLKERNLTLATAESITAGLLTSTIASVTGASSVLKGGIITYNEELKTRLLNVNPETLKTYSAESPETTVEMVKGLSNLDLKSDIYVAVTGVASESVNEYKLIQETGQIYVAVLFKTKLYTFETILKPDVKENSRNQIREKTVNFILDTIAEIITVKYV